MKNYTFKLSVACSLLAIGSMVFVDSCTRNGRGCDNNTTYTAVPQAEAKPAAVPLQQNAMQNHTVQIANIRRSADGRYHEVMFNELAELFTVYDNTVLAGLQDAFSNNKVINVQVDPWSATVLQVSNASQAEVAARNSRQIISTPGSALPIDLAKTDPEVINSTPAMVLNTTTPGLTNVIPDMATAQMMFDYITHQCCAVSGPYVIDHCIPFQYCPDGCYARAHKMCWIINNTYHYGTHKIFSFANSGSDRLSVKAEKWRGCCVTWWYHVAPLVNINTPQGVKAYVFDPAMFDQPVLLATWLHAQENPACSATPHVSMINIQPTASYAPSGMSGYSFSTDPSYSSTNSTLISYSALHTCY